MERFDAEHIRMHWDLEPEGDSPSPGLRPPSPSREKGWTERARFMGRENLQE